MEVELSTGLKIWYAGRGLSSSNQYFTLRQQLLQSCTPLQIYEPGHGEPNTYFTIQDTYCVDAVKDFWEERRSEAISQLQGKDAVLLGMLFWTSVYMYVFMAGSYVSDVVYKHLYI